MPPLADSCVWTSPVGRADTMWERWGPAHENKKGWLKEQLQSSQLLSLKDQVSLGLEEQTKPVVQCLEDACVKWASEWGQRLEWPRHQTVEMGNGRGWPTGVSQSIPCTGVHDVLCHSFNTLLPNSQISFAALKRWLAGTLKSSCFSGFRDLRKVALGTRKNGFLGLPVSSGLVWLPIGIS